MNASTVSASHGICVNGFFPGGGYSIASADLQEELQKAAALLLANFPNQVTVRCNSCGRSGGPFLIGPQGDKYAAQDQAGIGVRIDAEGAFQYDAHIMSGALARPEFANCDGSRGSRYGHFYVGGLAEALLVLKERANVPA